MLRFRYNRLYDTYIGQDGVMYTRQEVENLVKRGKAIAPACLLGSRCGQEDCPECGRKAS